MCQYLKKSIALGIIMTAVTASANVAAADWGYSLLPKDNKKLNEQVYASASDTAALSFMCNNTKLRALIATESNAGETVLAQYVGGRTKTGKKVTLYVEGQAVDTSRWLLSTKNNVFAAPDRSTTLKIYKAAASGKTVSIEPKGKSRIDLSLPAVNDAFRTFGADCGAGSNRKKQS